MSFLEDLEDVQDEMAAEESVPSIEDEMGELWGKPKGQYVPQLAREDDGEGSRESVVARLEELRAIPPDKMFGPEYEEMQSLEAALDEMDEEEEARAARQEEKRQEQEGSAREKALRDKALRETLEEEAALLRETSPDDMSPEEFKKFISLQKQLREKGVEMRMNKMRYEEASKDPMVDFASAANKLAQYDMSEAEFWGQEEAQTYNKDREEFVSTLGSVYQHYSEAAQSRYTDYDEALDFARNLVASEMLSNNPTMAQEELNSAIALKEASVVVDMLDRGVDPAQAIYNFAKENGFVSKKAQRKERINKRHKNIPADKEEYIRGMEQSLPKWAREA